MSLLTQIKSTELGAYSANEIAEAAEYLASQPVKLAYYKFWTGHLVDTGVANPSKGCNWKLPEYASGLKAWMEICAINGWE